MALRGGGWPPTPVGTPVRGGITQAQLRAAEDAAHQAGWQEKEAEQGDEAGMFKEHKKKMNKGFQDLHRALKEQKQFAAPKSVPVSGPFGFDSKAVDAAAKKKKEETPNIVIKQIVRQEVGTRKARKKRVATANAVSTKAKKKEYTTLKKALRKRLMQRKKDAFKTEAARINDLPPKERAPARKALRARLKRDHDAKLKLLPSLGRRKYNEIVALISKLKKIKW